MNAKKTLRRAALMASIVGAFGWAQAAPAPATPPLTIARQGYFYVGGHYDKAHKEEHMVGQLYAEFQIPANKTHPYPIVMIHGGSQTGVDWIGTPDGREGWQQYFLRRGYTVYVIDQVARGRAPYHQEFYGPQSNQDLTFDLQRFAAGEKYNLWPQAKLHTQWPGKAEPGDPTFDNYYASNVPSMADRTTQRQMNIDALIALMDKIGPAIILVHSQSGAYPWTAAQKRPNLVKGIVALEPSGPPVHDVVFVGPPKWFEDDKPLKTWGLTDTPLDYIPAATKDSPLQFEQEAKPDKPDLMRCWLQKERARKFVGLQQPILVVGAESSFYAPYNLCTSKYLAQAGAHPTAIQLADIGIHGNGHMMMIEKNSDQVAGVVYDWLEKNVK